MPVTADVVKVVLEGEVDGYNADIKSSVGVFESSMTKMERAAVRTEKTVSSAMTRSSKLTSSQLQTIQYTVNDVIASLSSGGNPLTILAQQGGQVTQAFGGLTGTLKSLAPFAFSAGGALTAFGLALGAAILAADKADGEFQDLQNSVTGLGRASGLSAQGLRDIAQDAAAAGKVGRAAAEDMAIAYANTGRIGGQVIGDLISITDDYARATGVDAKKATQALGAAFADPTKGAELLQSQFGLLDAKTYTLIKTMIASGDTAGAQVILFDRLSVAIGDQSEKVSGLTKFTNWLADGWRNAAAQARDYARAQKEANNLAQAKALGGVPTPAGEEERQANRAAFRRGTGARANQRATSAQALVDAANGDDLRLVKRGQIAQIERAAKEGSIDATKAAAAIKVIREDIAKIGAGPKAPKPTKAETRESAARAEGRYASGSSVDRGVQSIDVQTIRDLEKLFISRGGLEEYIKGGGDNFKAAGEGFRVDDETLKRNAEDLYRSTYDSIAYGLDAAFRDGVPGLARYLGEELQRSLVSSLAKGLTDLITSTGSGGTGGTIFSAIGKIFGRASGGNMVGGHPYLVNEGRPEVFVPPVSGKMVPVGRMGSSGQTVVNATFAPVLTVGAGADAREVALLRADLAKMKASFKSDVTNVVNDGVQRRTIRTGGN